MLIGALPHIQWKNFVQYYIFLSRDAVPVMGAFHGGQLEGHDPRTICRQQYLRKDILTASAGCQYFNSVIGFRDQMKFHVVDHRDKDLKNRLGRLVMALKSP